MAKRTFRKYPGKAIKASKQMPIKAAESYGWVVNDWEAQDAYEFACEYFGEEDLNKQIVGCMSSEELAACLAFLFRMNDFREWENRDKEDDEEEDDDTIESSTKIRAGRMALTPEHDSRASFYNKAFVEPHGDELWLISYTTHVASLVNKDGRAVVVNPDTGEEIDPRHPGWSQTTNRHIREFIAQAPDFAKFVM